MKIQTLEKWRTSTIKRSFSVISISDKKKLSLVALLQISLGILDLLGVAAIGIIGALAVSGVQSRKPGNRVNSALDILHLNNFSFQNQVAIIGLAAGILLIGRTLLSIFFTRKTLFFLSKKGAIISADLISKLLAQSLIKVQSRTTQETLYALTIGIETIMLKIVGQAIGLVSDLSLLIIMSVGLFLVDPTIALSTFLVFALIGFLLYKLMYVRARKLGNEFSRLTIRSNEKIIEVLHSYRESVVRNRRDYYARKIGKLQLDLAETSAEMSFMPNIGKYVIETIVVCGSLLIASTQFILQDATHAVATLSVFLAAGTRIAPAVLRVQQSFVTIRGSVGTANPTLELIESLDQVARINMVSDDFDTVHFLFESRISMHNVSLTYPGKIEPAINSIFLDIPAGSSIAIVGPSGAGKTTIIDVLLGVLTPDIGEILISGKKPLEAIEEWSGAISYVPQDVVITNGSIRENISLGFPESVATDELILDALKVANLEKFVMELPNGLETQVGERGTKLSGGQRQRLGIARALFTKPLLLVLDEATSSLDGEAEAAVSDAISRLHAKTTVVIIAHRLSTVRYADLVIYMDSGKIIAKGKFEDVRIKVPDFDKQAKLMGL